MQRSCSTETLGVVVHGHGERNRLILSVWEAQRDRVNTRVFCVLCLHVKAGLLRLEIHPTDVHFDKRSISFNHLFILP